MTDRGRWTVDRGPPSTLYRLPSTVHRPPSTVYRPPSTVQIEMGQLLLSVIFGPYRTIDTSDVILNAIGMASGYWLFALGEVLYSKRQTPKHHP